MRVLLRHLFLGLVSAFFASPAWAGDLDTIGVTQLRAEFPGLYGDGIVVAQAEAIQTQGGTNFEVRPSATGHPDSPNSLFTWVSGSGTATTFPNSVGTESSHANTVGNRIYGKSATLANSPGVAPSVSSVTNYEAGYFYNTLIVNRTAITARIVNQSFIFSGPQNATVDQNYDNYAARYNTLFVNGVGNGTATKPSSPATSYNGIAVGSFTINATTGAVVTNSSTGPTTDGRSKPDIIAPASFSSFSTPYVTGSAAILHQAANRGDAGAFRSAGDGTDARTVKALLLNGAEKPADWAHTQTTPLDPRYGAGILNVYNSYLNLTGGEHGFTTATTNTTGGAHAPPAVTGSVSSMRGWDLNTISSTNPSNPNNPGVDGVNHYFFDLAGSPGSLFTLTSTLTWFRQENQSAINNLDLFLYDAVSGIELAASISAVDNVEHLYVQNLAPGRYDLQVLKRGGATGLVSGTETYAVAFNFNAIPEPSAILLVGLGFSALLLRRTRVG